MFKEGDKVRIIKRNLDDSGHCKYGIFWDQHMDKYNGQVFIVKNHMLGRNSIYIYGWYFSFEWLELVDKPDYLNLLIKEYVN